ncbi:MAG TPA: TIGR02594 family protein [Chitinophagaceae bacterium]|nr:TIGR02594 family protein [Chitinophagaceae bacterium]
MNLPVIYSWLASEPGPKMVLEFLKIYGVRETPGDGDNPEILAWARELGIKEYVHDSIAWCGLCMAILASRAGKPVVKDPLWAANWLHFGSPATQAMLGDVLVFERPGGHHVALYIAEDDISYHVGGGNQSDMVCITRIVKRRCIGVRRPPYQVQPANVRPIQVGPTGIISTNES